jgi:SAM-dependent methyltransferase
MDLDKKERLEIEYWRDSASESPETFTKDNLLNKLQECRNLDYRIQKHWSIINGKRKILEIGAGQGWASCFLKKFYLPKSHFTVTDISPFAVQSVKYWETLFNIEIDKKYPCKSYEIQEKNDSFDFIFCYSAAHHFKLYRETLVELQRILKTGGHIIFFYEPTCSRLFYPLHMTYVNNAPHVTPEDVIIPSEIKKISDNINLQFKNEYDPNQIILRSIPLGIYFKFLKTFPFLQKWLPSSSDLVFRKREM